MASTRITCPDCKSVLRPAKPVPDGKKVKCPRCGAPFTAPGLVEEEPQRPRQKASIKKNPGAIKKAESLKPSSKKSAHDDDEDGGGIYGYVKENEQEEEDKPQIEYAPDMSIKDLRGPAQALIVRPSNYMILIGGLNCLCDILIICVCFWPMVFSEHLKDHAEVLEKHYRTVGGQEAATKIKGIPKERKDLKAEDLQVVEEEESGDRSWRFGVMSGFILLLVYHFLTVIGAVKVQNLESRGWGIASSIMTFLPMGAGGIAGVVGGLFYKTIGDWVLEEMNLYYSIGLSVLVYVLAITIGVWSLRVLLSQEVIDGFEYVAE